MATINHVQQPMTEKRKAEFLRAFREVGGIWAAACRKVAHPDADPEKLRSKHPPAMSSFRALAARDPEFGAQIQEILQECRDMVEAEIRRRGELGYTDYVYQKSEQVFNRDGTPAVIHRYSDNLLLARARALMPEKYSERKNVQHRGHITHGMAGHLQIESADLTALNVEQRKQLTGILKTIQESRRDVPAITYDPGEEILDVDFEDIDDGDTMALLERAGNGG